MLLRKRIEEVITISQVQNQHSRTPVADQDCQDRSETFWFSGQSSGDATPRQSSIRCEKIRVGRVGGVLCGFGFYQAIVMSPLSIV